MNLTVETKEFFGSLKRKGNRKCKSGHKYEIVSIDKTFLKGVTLTQRICKTCNKKQFDLNKNT